MREGRHRPRERAEGIGIDSEMEGAVEASESSVVSEGATKELREADVRRCWTGCSDAAPDKRPRVRTLSRMTGAALGGVMGRRPVVIQQPAGSGVRGQ